MARARALGLPFDAGRVALFTTVLSALHATVLPQRADPAPVAPAFYTLAFLNKRFNVQVDANDEHNPLL